jgi:hypothetical protein
LIEENECFFSFFVGKENLIFDKKNEEYYKNLKLFVSSSRPANHFVIVDSYFSLWPFDLSYVIPVQPLEDTESDYTLSLLE